MFGLDYYDAVLLSGSYQIRQLRELEAKRHLPAKELLTVGLPYFDELKQQLIDNPPPKKTQRTVLLAPSWGVSSILNCFGSAMMDALLATGYRIIVRPHPQSYLSESKLIERLQAAYPDSDQLQWNRDNDNFSVLNQADILISDFSGVLFDFALVFDKPILYADTAFDSAPYDACWLDEAMWTFSALPKIGIPLTKDNLADLKPIIDAALTQKQFAEARETARSESWEHVGEAAKRTVDYLIEKHRLLSEQAAMPAAAPPKAASRKPFLLRPFTLKPSSFRRK